MCPRWLKFENFLEDMGPRPAGMSLERRDNLGGYEPSNCCWASRDDQMRNTRQTRMVVVNGESMCVIDAAKRLGFPPSRIYGRVYRRGITHQEALDAIMGPRAFPGG